MGEIPSYAPLMGSGMMNTGADMIICSFANDYTEGCIWPKKCPRFHNAFADALPVSIVLQSLMGNCKT